MIVLQWNTKYTRENWIYFKDGTQVEEVSDSIAFEFERWDKRHNDIMWMNGKRVEISYDEKYWYFIKYKNWDENVIIDPIQFVNK